MLSPLFALVRRLGHRLGRDEAGFILSAELVLIGTIVVLGLAVGLAEISFAVNTELHDVAQSYNSLNDDADGRYSSLQPTRPEPESGGPEIAGY